MEFYDVVRKRRSIRKYTQKPVPSEVIERGLDAAFLAPNSSNLQTWQFFWIQSSDLKQKMVEACLSQSAARTAQELIFVVANPELWRKTNPKMVEFTKQTNAPKLVQMYYEKLVPMTYGWALLGPLKWILYRLISLFRPMTIRPATYRDLQEVSIKSAALAAENFMLAMVAEGYSTCAMEGFDERRVKKLLNLPCSARVVMGISVGEADPDRGTWGPQVRFDRDWFVIKK